MKLVRTIFCGLMALAMLGIWNSAVQAQEGRWGIGGFVNYTIPITQMRERFSNNAKFGGTLNYVATQSTMLEVEYHYSKFENGSPAKDTFTYVVDGTEQTNPNGVSEITFNSLLVNALLFMSEENSSHGFNAHDYRFYLAVGGGIYRYKSVNENLIYPRQNNSPIDPTLVMESQVDQRYTFGGNVGAGVEGFVTENLSIDLRGRYNFIVGELRPMLFYGYDRTRPIQVLDIGAQLKFYFWR